MLISDRVKRKGWLDLRELRGVWIVSTTYSSASCCGPSRQPGFDDGGNILYLPVQCCQIAVHFQIQCLHPPQQQVQPPEQQIAQLQSTQICLSFFVRPFKISKKTLINHGRGHCHYCLACSPPYCDYSVERIASPQFIGEQAARFGTKLLSKAISSDEAEQTHDLVSPFTYI